MATRVFSDDELERLRRFPEIDQRDVLRFFTLTAADEAFVASYRGPANRLGLAVQLCTLSWLGFVPDDVAGVPAPAVARLSERLGVPVGELRHYAERQQTRTDHLREVARFLGWRPAGELDEFLLHDAVISPQFVHQRIEEHDVLVARGPGRR